MNSKIKARWVEALRSGDYKQTEGYLNVDVYNGSGEDDGYCCLGVLCELAVADGVITKKRVADSSYMQFGDEDFEDWDYSVLPISVMKWAELDVSNPCVNTSDPEKEEFQEWQPLSEPNDNGATFEEIADWIERDL